MILSKAMESVLPTINEDVRPPEPTETEEKFDHLLNEHKVLLDDIQYKVFTPDEVKTLLEDLWERLHNYKNNEGRLLVKLNSQEKTLAELTNDLGEASVTRNSAVSLLDTEKQERDRMTSLLDECHLREQDYQELISSLRKQTKQLEAEIEKRKREHDELAAELGVSGRSKEAFYRDKERLKHENQGLKEDIVGLQRMHEELAQRLVLIQTKLEETQHNLVEVKNQNWDLMRDRGHMSREAVNQRSLVNRLKKCLITLKNHHDTLVSKLDSAVTTSDQHKKNAYELRQENKELKSGIAAEIQDMSELSSRMMDMIKENQHLKTDNQEKEKELLSARKRAIKAEETSRKTSWKASRAEKRRKKLENKTRRLETVEAATARGAVALEHEVSKVKQKLTRVTSDNRLLNAHLLRSAAVAQEHMKRLEVESQVKRSIELERDRLRTDLHKMFISNLSLVSEKERLITETVTLEDKVEETELNVKHKESCIQEMTSRLAEETDQLSRAISLYQLTKQDRDLLDMNTRRTRDSNEELKRAVKLLQKQLGQLTDQLVAAQQQINKQEKEGRKKCDETSRLEAKCWRNSGELKKCKEELTRMEKEQMANERYLGQVGNYNKNINRLLQQALEERDKVQKKADKEKLRADDLESKLADESRSGDQRVAQSDQAFRDVKLLRTEVLKLRHEKTMLSKAFENVADFRKEVYMLNKELTNERIRNTTLENEMETPVNFHRWRFIQGRDPKAAELLEKVEQLQKQLSSERQRLVNKDTKMAQVKMQYDELKNYMEKMPGPDALFTIQALQRLMQDKDQTIKSMWSEMCCLEGQLQDLRLSADVKKKEQDELKNKYYQLKLKADREKQKICEVDQKKKDTETIPELPTKQFIGGGFNMAPTLPMRSIVKV